MCFAVTGIYLFAGTLSGVVWKRPLSDMITSIEEDLTEVPEDFNLAQNYPNPFNPSTKIKYTIPSVSIGGVGGAKVQLKVHDLLGNEVATLVNDYQPAGSYEIEFNASGMGSGIYFYKLQSGSFVETKKMVLLK